MSCAACVVAVAMILFAAAPVARAEDLLKAARHDVEQGHYGPALDAIAAMLKRHPQDVDARLLRARIYGWQNNHDAALREFNLLLAENPANADVRLGRGYLHYAAGRPGDAARDFAAVLKTNPDYLEARQGLAAAQKAQAESARAFQWQADIGGDYSWFARRPQSDWHSAFIQLTRRFASSGTAVHLAVQRFHQFQMTDWDYAIGADQRLTPWLGGYIEGGGTPAPAFRPQWHLAGGGHLRFTVAGQTAAWATLDTRYEHYPVVKVGNVNPGLRLDLPAAWTLSGMMISALQSGARPVFGWQGKVEKQIRERWRLHAGIAHAPETVAGATINTRTFFGGLAVDLNAANTLRLGYAQDDRDEAYIRHAVNISFSTRF